MDVFDLSATLSLNTSEYENGLTKAAGLAHSVGGKIAGGIKAAGLAVGALAVAGTAVAGAFVGAAKKTADYGDKVDKMSQKIGISAEAYQKWDYVMQRAGGSVDSLKMGMKTLSQQAEKNSDSFQKLGISQEEVKNLSQEDLFQKTVEGLSKMEAGTERTALASQLLGRAGADMGPLLNQGSDAIKEQMEIAEKYGMVMPDAAVKASAAFEDSLTTMSMTFEGLKNRMMGEFLPAMTLVTDGMGKLFAGDMSGADDVSEGIQQFIDKMGEVLPVVLEIGGKIIKNLATSFVENLPSLITTTVSMMASLASEILKQAPTVIGALGSAVAGMFTALFDGAANAASSVADKLPEMMEGLPDKIGEVLQNVIDNLPEFADKMAAGIGNITDSIFKILMTLGDNIPKIIGRIASVLWKNRDKILSAGLKLGLAILEGIWKGVVGIAGLGLKIIGALWSALWKAAGGLGKKVAKIGGEIVSGIWKGISGGFDWIKKKIEGWVGNVVDFFKKILGIGSPSKVMAREVGRWIPEGVAKGIMDNGDVVQDAFDDLLPDGDLDAGINISTTAAESGQGKLLEGMGKVININNYINIDGAQDPEPYAMRLARSLSEELRSM